MANKKRRQRDSDHSKLLADAKRYTVRYGDYNGASSSDDFMVSGHSTGSPYSEMEELSNQVTRDAGGLPYREVEFANDQGETGYDEYQGEGLGDLGGPEFYGNKPSLLKTSPIHHAGASRGLAIAAGIGLAATAVLGGLSYLYYKTSKKSARRSTTQARGARTSGGASASTSTRAASSANAATQAQPTSARKRSGAGATAGKSKRSTTSRTQSTNA